MAKTLRAAPIFLAAFAFWQCELKTTYQPKAPETASYKVFHLGTYSTKLTGDEEKEMQGTIFQTTNSFQLAKSGAEIHLKRSLDTMVARGFHKLSMPNELEKKVAVEAVLDTALRPLKIIGYDSLKPVLGRIQQKDEYRKQLLASADPALFSARLRDWWRMEAMLPRGVEMEPRKALSVDEVNKTLELQKLDSARFEGPMPRGSSLSKKKKCLEYTVYYHRNDSLPLLVEQFFFSNIQNRKYRRHNWKPGVVQGQERFSVDRATGLPCFYSKSESADILLEKKEDKSEVPIQLFRYEEDIYEY